MIKINLTSNREEFLADINNIVKAFYPHISEDIDGECIYIDFAMLDNENYSIRLKSSNFLQNSYEKTLFLEQSLPKHKINSSLKREAKILLYDYLSKISGVDLPYGSLTGIRPTKLFFDTEKTGIDAEDYFKNELRVADDKIVLIKNILAQQSRLIDIKKNEVDVFINIPFCTTRCSYCSFICAEISKIKKFVPEYCKILIDEIRTTKQIITDNKLSVRALYVGGGTPTSLGDDDFESILKECAFQVREFTVEAGRPDTITTSKLEIMKKYGVNRISINPQSFNDKTLALIGRNHSANDIFEAFREAKTYGFDVNMDLIAMLPEESFDDFKFSLDKTLELSPENITIHTLALKAGSKLKENKYEEKATIDAVKIVDYAYKTLTENGYLPYYMYRLKYMSSNLENVGYCKPNKACIYNIDIMEEISTIIANGAGAISKRIFLDESRIERLANPKGLDVYLSQKDKILLEKTNFFANLV